MVGQWKEKAMVTSQMRVCLFIFHDGKDFFVCDLRVHSFRGVVELMWMLSIQMCPLVPCTK